MSNNMHWEYDELSNRYVVKGATIRFTNFDGAEQDYNQKGKRNFRLELDETLRDEIKRQGVYVRERPGRDEFDDPQYLMKVGIYPDADIRMLSGRTLTKVPILTEDERRRDPDRDGGALIDREFQKGHVENGKIDIEFHITKNTRVATSSPYVRVDTMIIPIRKSKLLEEYDLDDDEDAF